MFEKIRIYFADQLGMDAEIITPETNIAEDLNADSLDYIDLILKLEKEFQVELTDDIVQTFETVGDVAAFFENLEGEQA